MRILFTLAVTGCVSFGAQAEEYIALRATPGLSNEVIQYIANISEPRRGYIARNELPEDFIKQVCGNYTNAFGELFFGVQNPRLVREPKAFVRPALMPACAKWRRDDSGDGIPVQVLLGDTLDAILLRKIGRKANQLYKCSPSDAQPSRCGVTFRELVEKLNRGADLANLKPDQMIRIPFVTEITAFQVKADSQLSAAEHMAKIKELAGFAEPDSPLIQVQSPPAITLITAVDSIAAQSCAPSTNKAPTPWPYDEQLVAAVIKSTMSHVTQTYPTTLTIIDTGVDASFPPSLLRRSDAVDPKYAFGIGVYRRDGSRPYPDHQPEEVRLHGTEVARIAVGLPRLQRSYPDLGALFKVNVVNVMEPISSTGAEYGITVGGLVAAINWFTANGDIANISIASQSELHTLVDAVKRNPQLLVVSAAGNEGSALDFPPSWYPASYGGINEESGTQFVTVAANDASLSFAPFTNVSSKYVDLFAPGCDVPHDQSASAVTGTSFAAPLVSLTAALLRSFGLKSPKEIKRRLQASVDYDDNLQGLAVWSGRLNIAKALSLYDDVLELHSSSPKLEFGHWSLPDDLCKDTLLPATIRKINVKSAKDPVVIRILWSDSQEQLQETTCQPANDKLILQGRTNPIAWEDLLDFVPHRLQ
jgi:hypothetical protein